MARSIPWVLALAALAAPEGHAAQRPPRPIPPPLPRPVPPQRIIAPARARVVSTKVAARIVDGIAEATVRITLRNDGPRPAEKILLLPLPRGAHADGLKLRIGGKDQPGEVLPADKARRIYEDIVRRRLDPALLEYVGRGVVRLRVFPVPPHGETTAEVRFRLILPETGGLYRFEFPARAVEAGNFALSVALHSSKALKNVYSPVAGFDVRRKGDHEARASFECTGRPQKDPVLFYALDDRAFGLNLICHRSPGKPGYFVLMVSPSLELKDLPETPKAVTFVIDVSGSMQGEKFAQARSALRFFIRSLKAHDWFNIVPFSTEAAPFAPKPVPASDEKRREGLAFVDRLEARGGTNLAEALEAALKPPAPEGALPIVVLLTDGLPTVGETDPGRIVKACAQWNRAQARVFVLGVGYDVNTFLLDRIAADTRGSRTYVKPGENLEVATSALLERLAHPALSNPVLSVEGAVRWSRLVPHRLPDLFRGGRLVVTGRYEGSGPAAVKLAGRLAGKQVEFVFDASFPEHEAANDFVAALWAKRRIGLLLEQCRLHGESSELVAEVRRLGKEFGIVTPYTSQIVVEEVRRVARARGLPLRPGADAGGLAPQAESGWARPIGVTGAGDLARMRGDLARQGAEAAPVNAPAAPPVASGRAVAGKRAVLYSQWTEGLTAAEKAKAIQVGPAGCVRIGGFVLSFVGGSWVDIRFRKEMREKLRRIEAFSPAYFELLARRPQLAKVLAFSTALVLVLGPDEVVEITPPGKPGKQDENPAAGR